MRPYNIKEVITQDDFIDATEANLTEAEEYLSQAEVDDLNDWPPTDGNPLYEARKAAEIAMETMGKIVGGEIEVVPPLSLGQAIDYLERPKEALQKVEEKEEQFNQLAHDPNHYS